MKTRAWLVMRMKFVKGKDFPVFDGLQLTSAPPWDLTTVGPYFYSSIMEVQGKDYHDACLRFEEILERVPSWAWMKPFFPKNIEENIRKFTETMPKVEEEQRR